MKLHLTKTANRLAPPVCFFEPHLGTDFSYKNILRQWCGEDWSTRLLTLNILLLQAASRRAGVDAGPSRPSPQGKEVTNSARALRDSDQGRLLETSQGF